MAGIAGLARQALLAPGWPRAVLAIVAANGLLAGGCLPEGAAFRYGVGTHEIVGAVETPGEPAADLRDVLVIVFQHHFLFQKFDSEERVYRTSADVRDVDRTGEFLVPMPSDVAKLDLVFIAPGRLTNEFHFTRQLGIGQVTYRPGLPLHPDWYSHFYTYIQPILSNLVVEDRYFLSREDQQRVGDWLTTQAERLQAVRARERPDSIAPGE